jgi:hypothetical protein
MDPGTYPRQGGSRMTRGYKPVVAIGEAQRKATAWGFMLIGLVTEAKLPFDFVINDRGCTSLVRVRRLKYSQYGISDILWSCRQEIDELRELRIPEGIYRELWVRGPDRTWHRYLVLEEGIEMLENDENRQEANDPAGIPVVRQPAEVMRTDLRNG